MVTWNREQRKEKVTPPKREECVSRGQDIPATPEHDAGAIARCSYCGRYTDDKAVLRINWTQCSCGKTHGWCGSFKPPTEASEWSTHNDGMRVSE